ncbi:MAG: hypothetical protein JRJ85_12565, partial [Deltaproteobacteria bacterium]|nr:hypothetical protein [Deltaproteobacteria bacterium]
AWQDHLHRFHGLSGHFHYAIQGPAEQAIPLFEDLDGDSRQAVAGLLYADQRGHIIQNPVEAWEDHFLGKVQWDNLFILDEAGIRPLTVQTGQVLQQIGCPHASQGRWIDIDYPVSVSKDQKLNVFLKGCSFCDVAADKGFYGLVGMETVLHQIKGLPETKDGRKIPFELINENPLPGLPNLLREVMKEKLRLSRIDLILRADWFLKGEKRLRDALEMASEMGIHILLASVGFEAFDDTVLRNLNKGLDVETNLKAVRLMRRLKEDFPEHWAYSRDDGAIHGFIHPTPWDSISVSGNTQKNIAIYGLGRDVLPPHSTPLVIHHASGLADWIREVERKEVIHFKRFGSVIGWWDQEE